jgi:hypothetical protein
MQKPIVPMISIASTMCSLTFAHSLGLYAYATMKPTDFHVLKLLYAAVSLPGNKMPYNAVWREKNQRAVMFESSCKALSHFL